MLRDFISKKAYSNLYTQLKVRGNYLLKACKHQWQVLFKKFTNHKKFAKRLLERLVLISFARLRILKNFTKSSSNCCTRNLTLYKNALCMELYQLKKSSQELAKRQTKNARSTWQIKLKNSKSKQSSRNLKTSMKKSKSIQLIKICAKLAKDKRAQIVNHHTVMKIQRKSKQLKWNQRIKLHQKLMYNSSIDQEMRLISKKQ